MQANARGQAQQLGISLETGELAPLADGAAIAREWQLDGAGRSRLRTTSPTFVESAVCMTTFWRLVCP